MPLLNSQPQLQLALDDSVENGLKVLQDVHLFIDIIEVGTPLIYQEGMFGVDAIRKQYPNHLLLADLKIMDAGALEADIAFQAGADIVTVLGLASDSTIQGVVKSAAEYGKKVMVDMIQVVNIVERAKKLLNLSVDILCLHTAYDLQATVETPYKDLELLRNTLPHAALAIAGGVTLEKVDTILEHQPSIVVVGGGICKADNPYEISKAIQEKLRPKA